MAAIILAKIISVQIIVRLSNHYSLVSNEKSLLRNISEISKRVFYKWADFVVANSSELARDYKKKLGCNIKTIYNPINFNLINRMGKEKIKEPLFKIKKRPIVIGAGRLVKQKNFELLIKALAKVVAKISCDLVIIGEGSERHRLQSLINKLDLRKNVWLLGHRNNPYKYFFKGDLFVLSSKYEGMPNVLVEAIACGLPAVSTRCKSGPTEILKNGMCGKLVPISDVSCLANAIKDSLTNISATKLKYKMAKAHLSMYEEKNIFAQWFKLCKRVFNDEPRRRT